MTPDMQADGRDHAIMVAQLGARRHYLVPSALAEAGLLDLFVTDLYFASAANPSRFIPFLPGRMRDAIRRLEGRNASGVPRDRVRSFPAFGFDYRRRSGQARTAAARTETWLWAGERFGRLASRHLGGRQTGVLAFSSAALELFDAAAARGMERFLDHATAPRRHEMRLVAEEQQRFPGWALSEEHDDRLGDYHDRQMAEAERATRIICSSSFARGALVDSGIAADKISVVPLGITRQFGGPPPARDNSGPLRVLFLGSDGLRKGIGYLAAAKRQLRTARIEVRVAGDLEIAPRGLAELARELTLLGPVPRTGLNDLLAWAQVLVLPSVSDTFGLVVLEAMAAGIPVIASVNTCGPDVIRHGQDGYVVPIRDPDAIAACLDSLAADRQLLSDMGQAACLRSADYAQQHYASRLVQAIRGGSNTGLDH